MALIGGLLLGAPAAAQFVPSSHPPLPIPDGSGPEGPCGLSGPPVTGTITVSVPWAVPDLDVLLNVSHTWIGDLAITLTHGTTTVQLMDRPGTTLPTGCGDNSDGAADFWVDDEGTWGAIETAPSSVGPSLPAYRTGGRYTPNSPLSAFDDQPMAGTWTLSVTDWGTPDTGMLNSWGISGAVPTAGEGDASDRSNTLELLSGNPATGRVQFALTVADAQEVRVGLYDLLGRSVRPVLDRALTAGTEVYMEVNVADLAAGVYVLRAEGERFRCSRTFAVR